MGNSCCHPADPKVNLELQIGPDDEAAKPNPGLKIGPECEAVPIAPNHNRPEIASDGKVTEPDCRPLSQIVLEQGGESSMSAMAEHRAKRKASRAAKKASSTIDTHGFLSHLPEVQADIAYRFCFVLMGFVAERVVKSACKPETMKKQGLPGIPSKRAEEAYRCFSHVPFPSGSEQKFTSNGRLDANKFSSDVPKICRLLFNPFKDSSDILGCATRMEALSCSLICTLLVNPADGEPSFHDQIVLYERLIDQIRFTKKKLRPARAIVLFQRRVAGIGEGGEENIAYESWRTRLEEHQQSVDQKTSQTFGPIMLENEVEIHSTFATIASSRVMRSALTSGEDSDGSQTSEAPPCWGVETDGKTFEIEENVQPVWLAKLSKVDYGSEGELEFIPEVEGELERAPMSSTRSSQSGTSSKYSGKRDSWLSPMQKGAA